MIRFNNKSRFLFFILISFLLFLSPERLLNLLKNNVGVIECSYCVHYPRYRNYMLSLFSLFFIMTFLTSRLKKDYSPKMKLVVFLFFSISLLCSLAVFDLAYQKFYLYDRPSCFEKPYTIKVILTSVASIVLQTESVLRELHLQIRNYSVHQLITL